MLQVCYKYVTSMLQVCYKYAILSMVPSMFLLVWDYKGTTSSLN